MTRPADPVADRAAQIETAWAAYTTGLDDAIAEHKRRADAAHADFRKTERSLFELYRDRVNEINGTPPAAKDGSSDDDSGG